MQLVEIRKQDAELLLLRRCPGEIASARRIDAASQVALRSVNRDVSLAMNCGQSAKFVAIWRSTNLSNPGRESYIGEALTTPMPFNVRSKEIIELASGSVEGGDSVDMTSLTSKLSWDSHD